MICFSPATATAGAQGLEASAVTAPGCELVTTGCFNSPSGIAGFSGRPVPTGPDKASEEVFLTAALAPAFSKAPPSIQRLIKSTLASAMRFWLGGM